MNFRWKSWQRQETGEQKLNPFIVTRRGIILPRHENILPSFFEYSVKAWKYLPIFCCGMKVTWLAFKIFCRGLKISWPAFQIFWQGKKNPGRYEKRVGEAELAEARLAKAEPDPGRYNQQLQKTTYNQESYKTKAKKDKRQKQPNSEPDPGGDNNQQLQKTKKDKQKNECWAAGINQIAARLRLAENWCWYPFNWWRLHFSCVPIRSWASTWGGGWEEGQGGKGETRVRCAGDGGDGDDGGDGGYGGYVGDVTWDLQAWVWGLCKAWWWWWWWCWYTAVRLHVHQDLVNSTE